MTKYQTLTRAASMGVAVVAAVTLAACSGNSGTPASGSSTFTIGYTATLTGDFASYGLEMRQGVDLAVSEINAQGGIDGKQVSVTSTDDQGSPANGPVVAQKYCDNSQIDVVLGYSFSSVALAAVPVYQQCQLPVLASAVTSPQLSGVSPYFFRNVFTDAYQGGAMGAYVATTAGVKTIAVLYQQDDYGVGGAQAFSASYKAAGGKITSSQAYQLGTTDFTTLLNKIQSEGAQAIYIDGFYTESAKIAQQARSAGISVPLFGTDGSLSPTLISLGGSAVNGMTLYAAFVPTGSTDPKVTAFVKAYEAKYNVAPTSWAALAYDAVYTVKDAAALGGGSARANIAFGLPKVSGLAGVTGTTTINSKGDRTGSIKFITVKDGQFTLASTQ